MNRLQTNGDEDTGDADACILTRVSRQPVTYAAEVPNDEALVPISFGDRWVASMTRTTTLLQTSIRKACDNGIHEYLTEFAVSVPSVCTCDGGDRDIQSDVLPCQGEMVGFLPD